MEERQKSNKVSFAFGILLIILYVPQVLVSGPEFMSIIGIALGFYNICKHGFINDTSSWKIKPIFFVIPASLFLAFFVVKLFQK